MEHLEEFSNEDLQNKKNLKRKLFLANVNRNSYHYTGRYALMHTRYIVTLLATTFINSFENFHASFSYKKDITQMVLPRVYIYIHMSKTQVKYKLCIFKF